MQRAVCIALLLALSLSAEASFTFTRTNTATSQSSSTKLGKIQACSKVKTQSKGGGFTAAWTNANAKGINAAASTCSNAVAQAFSDACESGNSVSSVTAAAEACASATAKVYVSSLVKATASGNAKACMDTCSMAKANAQSVANAAADAIANATAGCSNVTVFVNSTAFTSAMVDAQASALTSACIQGEGKIWASANSMVSGLASSYAKTFAAAMAKACTCKGCKCPPIPSKATMEDLATSDSYSSVASGRRALVQSMADAAAKFCDGATIESAVKMVVDATVKVYTAALVNVQATLKLQGNAKGCTEAKGDLDVMGVANAIGLSLASAVAQNFNNTCGSAAAIANQAGLARDTQRILYKAHAKACGEKGKVDQTDKVTETITKSPLATTLSRVFSEIKNTCVCKGNCWCGTACDAAKYCPTFGLTGYGQPVGKR